MNPIGAARANAQRKRDWPEVVNFDWRRSEASESETGIWWMMTPASTAYPRESFVEKATAIATPSKSVWMKIATHERRDT